MLQPKIVFGPPPEPAQSDVAAPRMRLAAELREWWAKEQAGWDVQVLGNGAAGADPWGTMPVVDSKTVARMAPIFEKHGCPFDIKRIRVGGYAGIEDTIRHLVFGKGGSDPAERISQEVDS